MSPLFLNILLYAMYCIILLSKFKKVNLAVLIWTFYLFVSICSLWVWENEVYHLFSSKYILNPHYYTPFIINFFVFVLITIPIARIDEQKLLKVTLKESYVTKTIIHFGVALGFILTLSMPYYLVKLSKSNLFLTYFKVKEFNISAFPHLIELTYSLYSIFYLVLLCYLFYYITSNNNINYVYLLLIFVSAIMPGLMYAIGIASRGTFFFKFMDIAILTLFFRSHLDKDYTKILKYALFIITIPILLFILFITTSRFGNDIVGYFSIVKYFGEPFINFSTIYWGNVENHLYGERMIPDLYQYFSLNELEGFTKNLKLSYFAAKTGVPMHLFKTFAGDFYVEFGYWGLIVIPILFTLAGCHFIKCEKHFPFHRLLIYVLYFQICIGAIFNFIKSGHVNFLITIGYIFLYLLFRLNTNQMIFMRR